MLDNNTSILSGIYCIENIINNKKYVGQSTNINDRWRRHISELNKNKHENDYLQKSWNKYGEENFKFYILELCNIKDLDEIECRYINEFNTLNRDFGYNLKSGGQNGGSVYSDETKEKMSKSVKKSYTTELKNLRSEMAKNQWSNPEILEKVSGENNGMYGKHHSEETKEKIRKATKKPRTKSNGEKSVICIELNTIFNNSYDASKFVFGDKKYNANIRSVCYGKRQTCGGYHWKFYDDININNENNVEII